MQALACSVSIDPGQERVFRDVPVPEPWFADALHCKWLAQRERLLEGIVPCDLPPACLVVTKDVAGTIRAATVEAVEQLSEEEPLKSLRQKLLKLSPKSTWDMRGMFVSRDLHAPLNSRQDLSSVVNHAVTIMHYVTSCIKRWKLAIQASQVTCMAEYNMR